MQNQAPATVYRKKHIVDRLPQDFPEGADVQISKIRQSSLETWLAKYKFGYAWQTLYVLLLKALFDLALNDKMLVASPAAKLECKKIVKPIRITLPFEDFNAIVSDVRRQRFSAKAVESGDFLEFIGLVVWGRQKLAVWRSNTSI